MVFLADRGFADIDLMAHLKSLGWHYRIRIEGDFWVYRPGHQCLKVKNISLACGQARFWHHVSITARRYGWVDPALARPRGGTECWFVISDEPTDLETFDEYGLRFDIEENLLDDKSNGFQLESSLLRSAAVLSRLCFLLAITTLYLVSQGTHVVKQGRRRWVDPHWFRGSSYLKIGWHWVKAALTRGFDLSLLGFTYPASLTPSQLWLHALSITADRLSNSPYSMPVMDEFCQPIRHFTCEYPLLVLLAPKNVACGHWSIPQDALQSILLF